MHAVERRLTSEDEVDYRVLSDEVAASLPSPLAVMFPFAADGVDDDDDDGFEDGESKVITEDSIDDGKMSRYISTMTTSIAADILALQRNQAWKSEPSPLQVLVRMPPPGN